jgi:predicted RNA-binding Zn-ribbon protein involved in translation (DUF1610 family)
MENTEETIIEDEVKVNKNITCTGCGATLTIENAGEDKIHEVYKCPICGETLGEGFKVITNE